MSAGERSMQGKSRDIKPTSRATLRSLCICSLGSVCSSGLTTCCYHSRNKESVCPRGSPNRRACGNTSARAIPAESSRNHGPDIKTMASCTPPLSHRVQASDMLLQGHSSSLSFVTLTFSPNNVLPGYPTYLHIPSHPRKPYE
jgi:hypothetical protein